MNATFRELLEKYKDGRLSEEEKLLVEQELEKSEAINDYLANELEKSIGLKRLNHDEHKIFFENKTRNNNDLVKQIKKTVNRRFASVVSISVACMIAIVLIIQYIVSPLVASQYYNPTKKTSGQIYFQDLDFDLKAITTVSMPGYGVSGIAVSEDLGFGEYNIVFSRRDLFTNEQETINAKIDKNMRVGTFEMFYPRMYTAFSEFWNHDEGTDEYEKSLSLKKIFTESDIEHISELPSTSYISAWVRFPQDLNMKELYVAMDKFNNVDFKWIAIRTAKIQGQQLMGFSTGNSDRSNMESLDEYPGLNLVDTMLTIRSKRPYEESMSERYELHFTNLLKYLTQRKEAVIALVGNANNYKYEDALRYVEENGMSTYGALVYGEADDLMDLYESGAIMTLDIDNVVVSRYINNTPNH